MKTLKQDRELHKLIDEIYEVAYGELGYNTATLAAKSGLCYATVWRLENRETMYPRLGTVAALARVAGFELSLRRIVKARRAG